jgi:2-polyprenyl-3-methyl-5-hydroxy-6-metoxy-1,4-benzoquinol methylase
MPRSGELTYYDVIGEAGRRHALGKPFTDPARGTLLMQVGAVLQLLPPPPARILDCGCGTGWLSLLLHRSGYEVVGVDVSPSAIDLSRSLDTVPDREPPSFVVADVEDMPFTEEFDAVVFFDSLHHAVDELAAVRCAFQALKPGGMCVASETAPGHHRRSQEVMARYDVTEKDMPPRKIRRLGLEAGFHKAKLYPRADEIGKYLFATSDDQRGWKKLFGLSPFRCLIVLGLTTVLKGSYGITVLHK